MFESNSLMVDGYAPPVLSFISVYVVGLLPLVALVALLLWRAHRLRPLAAEVPDAQSGADLEPGRCGLHGRIRTEPEGQDALLVAVEEARPDAGSQAWAELDRRAFIHPRVSLQLSDGTSLRILAPDRLVWAAGDLPAPHADEDDALQRTRTITLRDGDPVYVTGSVVRSEGRSEGQRGAYREGPRKGLSLESAPRSGLVFSRRPVSGPFREAQRALLRWALAVGFFGLLMHAAPGVSTYHLRALFGTTVEAEVVSKNESEHGDRRRKWKVQTVEARTVTEPRMTFEEDVTEGSFRRIEEGDRVWARVFAGSTALSQLGRSATLMIPALIFLPLFVLVLVLVALIGAPRGPKGLKPMPCSVRDDA